MKTFFNSQFYLKRVFLEFLVTMGHGSFFMVWHPDILREATDEIE